MHRVELAPFTPEYLPDAGALLSARHRRDRQTLPELPPRFEDQEVARLAVAGLLEKPFAGGFVARRGGRAVAYMVGALDLDEVWGRSGWVRPLGFAVADDEDPETLRHLYAAVGAEWVRYGCLNHFIVAPTADPALLHKFYSLAFGIEQVHGLLDLRRAEIPEPAPGEGVTLRRVEAGDRETLEQLSDLIWRHQVQAPVWGVHLPERQARHRREYGELVNDEEAVLYLAFADGRPAGLQGFWPVVPSDTDYLSPENCVELGLAGTVAERRGRGIGTALARHGLREARAAGADFCLTDWRSTNLLSSRFWPSVGFRPVAYRLGRRLDPRIPWASGL
jgi:ribosomal protein S18 acetylase RimI-like enzyme